MPVATRRVVCRMIDELLFLTWSRVLGRPWSPDPWLRAKQRKGFSLAMAERKVAEIAARSAVIEELQHELVECIDDLDAWAERARLYELEAQRQEESSPWVAARTVDDSPESPIVSRHWMWEAMLGAYMHVDRAPEETDDHD